MYCISTSNRSLIESYSRVKHRNVNIRGKKVSRAMCVVFVFYRVSTFGSKASIRDRCCDAARENGVYGLVRKAKWSQWFSIGAAIKLVYSVAKKFACTGRMWPERIGERLGRGGRTGRKRRKMGRRQDLINGFGANRACL